VLCLAKKGEGVKNPVRILMMEHDRVGELLAELRQVTTEYAVPPDACFSYRELYRRLPRIRVDDPSAHPHREQHLLPTFG
jgi:regulator of cell morphogenesis and NO signaling